MLKDKEDVLLFKKKSKISRNGEDWPMLESVSDFLPPFLLYKHKQFDISIKTSFFCQCFVIVWERERERERETQVVEENNMRERDIEKGRRERGKETKKRRTTIT